MEIFKIDIIGSYSYKSDIENISYNKDESIIKECVICKRSLFESSYETISNNKNLLNETEIIIGKCGHIFHEDCICNWLKTSEICPIDKVKWCVHRTADTTTKLVVYNNDFNKKNFFKKKYLKNMNGEKIPK